MSIIAKLETWLRGIVRDEVSQIDSELRAERVALFATIRSFDGQLKSFDESLSKAVAQVVSCSPPHQENAELRATITALNGNIAECRSLADRIFHPEKYCSERHQQT